MKQSQKTTNERFTDIADRVSETMGRWWVTITSVFVVLLWLASGPFFHFSDTWQLLVNTPTTIIELWIGFLLAASANRVERHNQAMQEQQLRIVQHIDHTAAREEQEVAAAKRRLLVEDRRMEAIMEHLDKQDAMILQIAQRLDAEQHTPPG